MKYDEITPQEKKCTAKMFTFRENRASECAKSDDVSFEIINLNTRKNLYKSFQNILSVLLLRIIESGVDILLPNNSIQVQYLKFWPYHKMMDVIHPLRATK